MRYAQSGALRPNGFAGSVVFEWESGLTGRKVFPGGEVLEAKKAPELPPEPR